MYTGFIILIFQKETIYYGYYSDILIYNYPICFNAIVLLVMF